MCHTFFVRNADGATSRARLLSLTLFFCCLFLHAPSSWAENEEQALARQEAPRIPTGVNGLPDLLLAAARGELRLIDLDKPVPVPPEVEEIRDIEYGNADGRPLLLNLYLPRERTTPVPGLVFIHGGGWQDGNRTDYTYYTVRFPLMGYAAATISYRLAGEAPFPAAVHDAKCAVRWMRAHAAQYGIDPNAIAAIGGSAGGHLAMMLGYSADVPELEGTGGHVDQSSAVQAVVNLYGPTDLTQPQHHEHPTLMRFFGGKTYHEAPDLYILASPMTHLKAGAPPTLVFHGTADDIVPVEQADALVARLRELGVPHAYVRLEGYPHTMDIAEELNRFCRWHMYRFLDTHLKKRQPETNP